MGERLVGEMLGSVKQGLGTLIGNAGEYYVVAELLRRGIVADLAPRNSPSFDVLATRDGRSVRIRVKTKTGATTCWQWNAKEDGTIFRELHDSNDYSILVDLGRTRSDLRFFVVRSSLINEWLTQDFDLWLATPGAKGQQRSATNRRRILQYHEYSDRLAPYLENWDSLWKEASSPGGTVTS